MKSNPMQPGTRTEITGKADRPGRKTPAKRTEKADAVIKDTFASGENAGAKEVTIKVAGVEKKVILDPGRTIDEAIALLSYSLSGAQGAKRDLQNANVDIDGAQNDLRRADWPIMRVERDTNQTDVSREGYTLDWIFNDVERDDTGAKRDLDSAGREMSNTTNNVSSAHGKVSALEQELSSDPENYGTVINYLRQAGTQIANAYNGSASVDRGIEYADREVNNADRELRWTWTYTNSIKSDRVGKDVSSDGRQLSFVVNRAESDLRNADSYAGNAQYNVGGVESNISGAIQTLKQAKAALDRKI